MSQQVLSSPSSDIWLEILIFISNDLKTVMNFGMTCSEYWNLLKNHGDGLWSLIILKEYEMNPKHFKTSTLSILNAPAMTGRSEKLLKIIKTQKRYETKRKIVKQAKNYQYFDNFRFFENLNVKDNVIVPKLISGMKSMSVKYSAENIIREHFNDSPFYFVNFMNNRYTFHVADVIDAFYRKTNAHLEMDIKNRTMVSSLYLLWKQAYSSEPRQPYSQVDFFRFIHRLGIAQKPSEVVLFLKFFFLECPNVMKYEELVAETGYEQEQHNRGIFKGQLDLLRDTFRSTIILVEGINLFEKELYGDEPIIIKSVKKNPQVETIQNSIQTEQESYCILL